MFSVLFDGFQKIHKIQKERVFDNNLVVYYTQERKEIKDQSRAYLALMQVTALSNLISIQVNSEPTYQPLTPLFLPYQS